MTQVSLLPPRVDLLLYAGNTASVVFAWDTLPAGTWTATISADGEEDLVLDVDVAGTEVTVNLPDLAAYAAKSTRLELALSGEVLIAGRVFALTTPGTPSSQTVTVTTPDELTVAVSVVGVPGPPGVEGPPGAGAVDSVNGQTGVVVLDAADVGAEPTGTAAGLVATEATTRGNADTVEATARASADTALDGRLDTIEALSIATDAELAAAIETHRADTTNVHGIADTAALETTTGAQAKVDAEAAARDAAIQTAFAAFIAGSPGSLDAWLELVAAIEADQSGLGALTTVVASKETPAGAQAKADAAQAAAVQRANHTGTQPESTVTGLVADLAAKETPAGAQAKADAKVTQTITNGVTATAPSEDVVFDALALKAALASPTFTGTPAGPIYSASGLTGAVAGARFVGATASGAPTAGTFGVGDYVVDQTGNMWVCTSAGTPGTWVSVGSGRELGYAEITSSFAKAAASATPEDVTGLSITITKGSRPVMLHAWCSHFTGDTNLTQATLQIADSTPTLLASSSIKLEQATNSNAHTEVWRRINSAAGTYTYKVRLNASAVGKPTLFASATAPAFIRAVEV